MKLSALNLMLLLSCAATVTSAEPLTIPRLFSGPDLSGPQLKNPLVSPDGKYVTYLQGKPNNNDQLDLWAFDIRKGRAQLLVDSEAFLTGGEKLSSEEAARRERQRTANLRGIVEYQFSDDGQRLLVPLGGDLYVYDLNSRSQAVRRLTQSSSYETDARFSPRGNFVSFVRDQNLWIIDLRTGKERQLTTDGAGPVANGVAEFVAQEEMARNTGYWWSPDEQRIAFLRADESPVAEVERFEIYADSVKTVKQRYPAAGTANAIVALKVLNLASNAITNIDLGTETNIYIPRVSWFPNARFLAVQRESRNQQRLDLLKCDVQTGQVRTLLTENSNTWINLGSDPKFIPEKRAFIWSSERTGYRHLYLYDEEGELLRPLTAGPWMVDDDNTHPRIIVDGVRSLVFFVANEAGPTERHLYATSLDTTTPLKVQRLSRELGWHDATVIQGYRAYLDMWSSPDQPPSVAIRNIDGSLRQWIVRNALDAQHPYAPYLANHIREEFGSLRARDGQTMQYRLLKPANAIAGKRYPVVIDIYGGPGVQYVKQDWMGGGRSTPGYFRELLAQHGFIVFSLDNRGTASRGSAFQAPIFRQLGKIEIEDQLRGVEFLKSLDYVDAARIGIMGWSYGGYMALMALTTAPQIFKAGVAGAPVTDWRLYDTHYTERYLGDPAQNLSGYQASGIVAHLKSLQGRLFLVHGMADDNVLFVNSTQLMKALQDEHLSFDLMTYPGGKHGLARDPTMGLHYYESVLKFFQERL